MAKRKTSTIEQLNCSLQYVRTPGISFELKVSKPPVVLTDVKLLTGVRLNRDTWHDFSVTLDMTMNAISNEDRKTPIFDLNCKVTGYWHSKDDLKLFDEKKLIEFAVKRAIMEIFAVLRDRVRMILSANDIMPAEFPWALDLDQIPQQVIKSRAR